MSKDLRQFLHLVRQLGASYYLEVEKPLKPKYVVVDKDINVYDESEVWWAIGTRTIRDVDISVHHSSAAAKIVIDATVPQDISFPSRVSFPQDVWHSMKLEHYL